VPVPELVEPTDAILRVTLATICGSDIHIVRGESGVTYPKIVGHEFCGEILELGSSVRGFRVGDRVAVACAAFCGECYNCKEGIYGSCTNPACGCFGALAPEGSQSEYVRLPYAANCMYRIPEGLTEEDLLFVGDILSTGYFGSEQARIQPGDTIAVIGSGPVGMCAMLTARLWGPDRVIAVDMNQSRLDVALREGIADIALNPKEVNVVKRIRELTDGRGADRVIEAIGTGETLNTSLDAVRNGGNVCTIGIYGKNVDLRMPAFWHKNITLSMGFVPINHIPGLIKLIQAGKINTRFLMTHRAPLNDIINGYDIFGGQKDGCLKWVITPYER
jgi:alcohol dehydrogenase